MSSIRTLLLSAPTLADLIKLHQCIVVRSEQSCASRKTIRRWHEATLYRLARFIREAQSADEVASVFNTAFGENPSTEADQWKEVLGKIAQKRIEELEN